MSNVRVHDKEFTPYITEEEILKRIKEIAARINKDYAGKSPLFIAILNGSFMFAADLFKELTMDAEICFIKLASYRGSKSTGRIVTAIGLDAQIADRDIVIVEDIVDTGKTMNELLPQLYIQQPASLKIAALLHKPEAVVYPVPVDYCCFSIPNMFVLGYGLDYGGLGRNLRQLYQLIN
jgi:hypoxanthine phosphoribosyltransferase